MAKRGRPFLENIDEQLIEDLAAECYSQPYIAKKAGCSVDTLHNNYSEALKRGEERMKGSLKRRQFELAMSNEKGNVTMLIWLGKQYLAQRDKSDVRAELAQPSIQVRCPDGEVTTMEVKKKE